MNRSTRSRRAGRSGGCARCSCCVTSPPSCCAPLALVILIVSGPVAESVGDALGRRRRPASWSGATPSGRCSRVVVMVGGRAALLGHPQRAVRSLPADLGRRLRGDPGVAGRLGRLRLLRRQLLLLQRDLRLAGRRRGRCCCGCGSPTWRWCSAPSSTPSSSAGASSSTASRPRRRSSCRCATTAASRRRAGAPRPRPGHHARDPARRRRPRRPGRPAVRRAV